MALLSRKLKTPGKWFRVNEIVRNNAELKTTLNLDATIRAEALAMLEIVNAISIAYGLPTDVRGNAAEKSQNAFPITKGLWLGELALDTYIPGEGDRKVPEHRKAFATAAHNLRARTNKLIAAYRSDADVYNTSADANPGGPVA